MNWGGAQWVLITLLVMSTILPLAVRTSGIRTAGTKTPEDFWATEVAKWIERISLVLLLWWGGFWS